MSRNPLIATPTVDKNGKNTTVYRKTTSSAPVKGLPVPTLKGSKQGAQTPSTPLPVPVPIADAKLDAYRKSLHSSGTVSVGKQLRPNEAALIRDIIDRGYVSDLALLTTTGYMGFFSAGERIRHYDYNMLLLLERVYREEGKDAFGERPTQFADAVEGLGMRRRESDHITVPPITTEEELDSLTAVVRMMMFVGGREESGVSQQISERKEHRTIQGHRLNGRAFKNHAFTALIRERYMDYPRIERFVSDRGVPSNKASVDALRDYLDSGDDNHDAVVEGWL
jgi:hypothetical protein